VPYRTLNDVPGATGWAASRELFRRRFEFGEVLRELSQRHGDLVRIPVPGPPKVLLTHPDDIQEVLATKAQYYQLFAQDLIRQFVPFGIIATEGQLHDETRSPLLLSMRKILSRRLPDLSQQRCLEAVAAWRDGEVIDLYRVAREVTLAISASMLMPRPAQDLLASRIDHAALLELTEMSNAYLLSLPPSLRRLLLLPQLPHLVGLFRKSRQLRAQMRGVLSEIRSREWPPPAEDALTLLTEGTEVGGRLPEEFLLDNLLTLLVAGFETTANVLSWAMWETARREDVQQHIAAEAAHLSDVSTENTEWVNEAPWTDAVVREALRLYPSVWFLARQSIFECRLRDHLFDKGTVFYTSAWVTHRDSRWFPEPERFLPERWLQAQPSPETSAGSKPPGPDGGPAHRPPFAYFPFGGGKRFCLGKAIFDYEASLLLGTVFRDWRLEPVEGCQPRPRFLVTMRPDRPVLVRLRRR
jgi:cytochrome P450